MGEPEVAAYLSHLAVDVQISPSTQNQALNALVFMYWRVIERSLAEIRGAVRAKKQARLPVVLTREVVAAIFRQLTGVMWLIAGLQYGSGLRLKESLPLRVKELDFAHRVIFVRDGKGAKDRVVTLAEELIRPFYTHVIQRGGMAAQSPLGATLRLNGEVLGRREASGGTPKRALPEHR
jgi:site-specific recombinase XerD